MKKNYKAKLRRSCCSIFTPLFIGLCTLIKRILWEKERTGFLRHGNRHGGRYLELPWPGAPSRFLSLHHIWPHIGLFSVFLDTWNTNSFNSSTAVLCPVAGWGCRHPSRGGLLGVFTVSSWNSMCLVHSRCSQPAELITTPLQAAPNRAVQGQRQLNQILPYSLRHCLLTIRAEEIRISQLFILCLCTSVWKHRRIIPTLVTVVPQGTVQLPTT